MSKIVVYISSVTGSSEIKKKQQRILMVLEGRKLDFDLVDIAINTDLKDEMRKLVDNPTALPPQIFNGTEYLGDYDAFDDAVESEALDKFLKL